MEETPHLQACSAALCTPRPPYTHPVLRPLPFQLGGGALVITRDKYHACKSWNDFIMCFGQEK